MGRGCLAAPGRRLVLSSILPSHRPGINHSFLWGSNILRNFQQELHYSQVRKYIDYPILKLPCYIGRHELFVIHNNFYKYLNKDLCKRANKYKYM